MKNLFRWLRAIGNWVKEPALFWLTVSMLVIAIVGGIQIATEPAFRIIGLALQILGMGTVAWGIRETKSLFEKPSTLTLAIQWLRRFPPYNLSVVFGVGIGTMGTASVLARGETWTQPDLQASIESRLNAIEQNLSDLRDRLRGFEEETRKNLGHQIAGLNEEKRIREEGDNYIRAKLEATEVGGLHVAAMGVVWLGVGLIMSTMSIEWATWIR